MPPPPLNFPHFFTCPQCRRPAAYPHLQPRPLLMHHRQIEDRPDLQVGKQPIFFSRRNVVVLADLTRPTQLYGAGHQGISRVRVGGGNVEVKITAPPSQMPRGGGRGKDVACSEPRRAGGDCSVGFPAEQREFRADERGRQLFCRSTTSGLFDTVYKQRAACEYVGGWCSLSVSDWCVCAPARMIVPGVWGGGV